MVSNTLHSRKVQLSAESADGYQHSPESTDLESKFIKAIMCKNQETHRPLDNVMVMAVLRKINVGF
jgi:hypothetical protein